MAFVTGMLIIEVAAAALNNAGNSHDNREGTFSSVKFITVAGKRIPYVSAQAVRFWLRSYLKDLEPKWQTAPTYKENENLAYTAADPIEYWDDDLFGYMRAPTATTRAKRQQDPEYAKLTPLEEEKGKELSVTRISPFRMSTLVAVADIGIAKDWGTMARHDGNPVLHQHEFYHGTMEGIFSLNITTAGTFFNGGRVGYKNLEKIRIEKAVARKLEPTTIQGQPAYRIPITERCERVSTLFRAMGNLQGGAKLALHYTDVTPAIIITAVLKSGNNPFGRLVRPDSSGNATFLCDSLAEIARVYKDQLLSDVFFGWARGYMDEERKKVEALTPDDLSGVKLHWGHPREVMADLANELTKENNYSWYD